MTHLGIENISYGQKKNRESNYHFDLEIALIYLHAGGVPHIMGKLLTRVTTLF
jgi:hypothetical protein